MSTAQKKRIIKNPLISNLISKTKTELEMRLIYGMNWPIIQKIQKNEFFAPTKNFKNFALKDQKIENDNLSVSTADTENMNFSLTYENLKKKISIPNFSIQNKKNSIEKKFKPAKSQILLKEDKKILSEMVASGDKKVKTIVHKLLRFEENCISDRTVKKEELEKLRELSRGLLSITLKNYENFRFQHAESLSLSILLLSAIKIGMTKKVFLALVKKISAKKITKIDLIRKSKSYCLLKKIEKTHRRKQSQKINFDHSGQNHHESFKK